MTKINKITRDEALESGCIKRVWVEELSQYDIIVLPKQDHCAMEPATIEEIDVDSNGDLSLGVCVLEDACEDSDVDGLRDYALRAGTWVDLIGDERHFYSDDYVAQLCVESIRQKVDEEEKCAVKKDAEFDALDFVMAEEAQAEARRVHDEEIGTIFPRLTSRWAGTLKEAADFAKARGARMMRMGIDDEPPTRTYHLHTRGSVWELTFTEMETDTHPWSIIHGNMEFEFRTLDDMLDYTLTEGRINHGRDTRDTSSYSAAMHIAAKSLEKKLNS